MKLGQGRDNAKNFLKDNPDIAEEIEAKIRATLGSKAVEKDAPKAEEKKEPIKKTAKSVSITIDAEDDFEEFAPVEDK